MALNPGTKLGPYEIVSAIGAGGMGEVYKARDSRLDRDVAIKILPSHLAGNANLKQRFEREAKAISALNHPHICTLHDIGREGDTEYLVLEFLEGESLAKRLERGPLPVPELLKTAVQIADGLDRAHRSGIVHRDLKPGNIVLTKGGAKLLDFGLAKPNSMATASAASLTAMTMSTPASPITQEGTIVGTYQYMAPEQLEGKDTDARSDIFAFGSVMYEMATGKRAFDGKSNVSVMSAILEKQPEPISSVHPLAPPQLDHIVQRALAKDPEERWQSAADIKLELQWLSSQSSSTAAAVAKGIAPKKKVAIGKVAALCAAGIILAFTAGWFLRPQPPAPSIRAVILPPEKINFDLKGDYAGPAVISPDGQTLVFVAHGENSPKALWLRPLNSISAQRLGGTEGASFPFWSPDGKWIAFFAEGVLKKISAGGGPALTLAEAVNPRGGSWSKDDVILYAPNFQGPLYRVSARGGTPTQQTKPLKELHTTHRWPHFLPDGQHFLYLVTSHSGKTDPSLGVYFASLDGSVNKLISPSDAGMEYANGYLLSHVGSALMAQPFDPSKGELRGEAAVVVDHVQYDSGVWRTLFSAAQNGTLLYQSGDSGAVGTDLTWVDRTGKKLGTIGARDSYIDPRLSRDGSMLAVTRGDPVRDIWTIDLKRNVSTRLTFGGAAHLNAAWSPDGKYIAYTVGTQTSQGGCVRYRPANGGGEEVAIGDVPQATCISPDFSSDGRYLTFVRGTGPGTGTIYAVDLQGDKTPFVVVAPANPNSTIVDVTFSPNGKWVAYTSTESGALESYVTAFRGSKGRWQISRAGGAYPMWRRDGKELYFMDAQGAIYAVPVTENGDALQAGTPEKLFQYNAAAVGRSFDVTADGKRFLLNNAPEQEQTPLVLVTNWLADLKK